MEIEFGYNIYVPHTFIISAIVKATGCKIYMELGLGDGTNIKEIVKHCKYCIGVDSKETEPHIIGPNEFEFHMETTDEFFKKFDKSPNIIFIDADHNFEQVKRDFMNSLNCLSEHGIIFLHDTDPISENLVLPQSCGDSYKIHNWIKEEYPNLNILTLPINSSGLTVVNRDKDRRCLKFLNKNVKF